MIKNFSFFLAVVIAMASGINVSAADPALVSGKLSNGLSYYIYRNAEPAGRADFFLSRSIGSIVEKEEERGLAHFLEHLAFNGTEHFPGNSMIAWLESVGVKFGENLNAYTSIDETVYNISKVPVDRKSVIDSCLLVLRDWSCALTLDDDAIEGERGVIKGEWRHRNNALNRLLQKAAPRIYGSSLYGHRLPMGLMSVVENFHPQVIRDFYLRNYTPDTEAVIIVGDIEPKKIEKQIIKLFSSIPASKTPVRPDRTLETGQPLTAIAETDAEQSVEMVQLFFRHPASRNLSPQEDAEIKAASSVLVSMLVERFDRVELASDAAAVNIGIGDTRFLLSEPMRALIVRGNARPGIVPKAVRDFNYEIRRARELGFSNSEFKTAVDNLKAETEAEYEKNRTRTNTQIARQISRAFLHGEELTTPVEDRDMALMALSSLTKSDVEAYLRSIVHADGTNALILHYSKDPESASPEAEARLRNAFSEAATLPLEAYNPESTPISIPLDDPIPGHVVAVDPSGPFSSETVTLSNGLKVRLRHSTDKPGQIYFRGTGTGGLSQNYSVETAPSLKLFNEAISVSGAGEMSNSDIRRFLHGKDLKVSVMASNTEETMEFAASPRYLEDAFRLLYLRATDTRPDTAAFRTFMTGKINQVSNRRRNPIQTMGDSITCNVYSRHPLGSLPSEEKLRTVNYDTIMSVCKDRFADFSDFTFYMTGDFDRDSVKPFLERYVASLPVNGRVEKPRDIDYRFSSTRNIEFSLPMETPVSVVYQFRHSPVEYSLENVIMASTIGQILKARLLADMREEKGWTYSITTHGSVTFGMNGDDPAEFMLPVYVKVDPAHYNEAASVIDNTLEAMASGDISITELDKVKEYMRKSIRDNRNDNAYWLLALRQLDKSGLDMDSGYEDIVDAMTPEKISRFLKEVLDNHEIMRITMTPEG